MQHFGHIHKNSRTGMEYCYLGNSGLEVSRLGLGAVFFGTTMDEKTSERTLEEFMAIGGNLLDTSNVYGSQGMERNTETAGTSEKMVGKIIKGKRNQLVLTSKGYWLMDNQVRPNSVGLSRTYLTRQVEASLRRLDTDYIDLYQCHVWDFYTPIEETLRVLDDLVTAGKIRYVGASNWDAWHVVRANGAADRAGIPRILSDQVWYCLADRTMEHAILPACRDQGV